MIHKIISTFGLGVLGVDPITAVYLLAMGLRNEKKSKIAYFFFSFAGFTIVIGATLAAIFGVAAIDFLKSIVPGDNSPFWAVLNFIISGFILIWVCKKLLFSRRKKQEEVKKELINGNSLKYITTGFLFALSCFTDPTYYAVILMGGESGNFFTAATLLCIWFIVSQFMAVAVYIANEINLLDRLVTFVEKVKQKDLKAFTSIFYTILILIAIALLADAGFYLFTGNYLF